MLREGLSHDGSPPRGLVINVAALCALKFPFLHGRQAGPEAVSLGRCGAFPFVKLKKLFRTGIKKCTGIHFLHTITIPVLNVICLILLLNAYETALFHHTGTTERHCIGTVIIQNLSQLSFFSFIVIPPLPVPRQISSGRLPLLSYYHYYIFFSR